MTYRIINRKRRYLRRSRSINGSWWTPLHSEAWATTDSNKADKKLASSFSKGARGMQMQLK